MTAHAPTFPLFCGWPEAQSLGLPGLGSLGVFRHDPPARVKGVLRARMGLCIILPTSHFIKKDNESR
jgi:hypothetical protein